MVALLALLCGCSPEIRMLRDPVAGTAPEFGWVATAPDGLSVTMHSLLVRDSPGSWVHAADWDEFILEFKSGSSDVIQVKSVQVISPHPPSAQSSTLSLTELENESRETLRKVRDVAVVAGPGLGFLGTSVALGSQGYIAGAVGAGVGLVGIVVVGLQAEQIHLRRNREHQDRSLIELAILERGIHLPLEIAPGAQAIRSAFFPITPGPGRLIVDYQINGESRSLMLELPALAQLHIGSPLGKK